MERMFDSGEVVVCQNQYAARIKYGSSLVIGCITYAEGLCQEATNLHNTTNFYIRQVFTALRQDEPLQPLQQQVMDTLQANIGLMNERQREAHQKRIRKQV